MAERALAESAAGDDPGTGLRPVRSLRERADHLEVLQVSPTRELGWSWKDVADAPGMTRHAVHKKRGQRG